MRVEYPSAKAGLFIPDASSLAPPGAALFANNCDFSPDGSILARVGTAAYGTAVASMAFQRIAPFVTAAGVDQLLASDATKLHAFNSSGVTFANVAVNAAPAQFARFAAPGSTAAYCATGADTIKKWDGTTFSAPAGMPKGSLVAVQSPDNRLVVAGFVGATDGPASAATNPSRVWFSDSSAPESWTATSSFDLGPGDGEPIVALIAWNNYVFAFKKSRYWVFYGNDSDQAGRPLFRNREVAGPGCVGPKAITATPEGVYFLANDGVYLTNGGPPKLISQDLGALFTGDMPLYYEGAALNQAQLSKATLASANNTLYVAVPTGSATDNDTLLVRLPHGAWTRYTSGASINFSGLVQWRGELFYCNTTKLYRFSTLLTGDYGTTTVPGRVKLGWIEPADGATTGIHRAEAWGIGTATLSFATDFASGSGQGVALNMTQNVDTWGDGTNPADTWADGTNPADLWSPGASLQRVTAQGFAARGRQFCPVLDFASVSRFKFGKLVLYFAGQRKAG